MAAVVIGPGSEGIRNEKLAALMAQRGIAAVTYDKRGTGQSGGDSEIEQEREQEGDISAAHLQLLADDAAAVMAWLATQSEFKSLPRGFVAISQSGWVVPMAVSQAPPLNFLGFWSGPVCTTSEQLRFQRFSERHDFDIKNITADKISRVMARVKYRPDDVDPTPYLAEINLPALWFFGADDEVLPIQLSIQRLQNLIDRGQVNFHYRLFPNQGHNLVDSPSQESFTAMIDWIKRVVKKDTKS